MERYTKNLRFEVAPGRFTEMELNLRRVVPRLTLPAPKDLALDFSYVIGRILELDESDWQSLGLATSRSIPNYVLHQLYDARCSLQHCEPASSQLHFLVLPKP